MPSRDEVIDEFIETRPLLHHAGGEAQDWGLEPEVLRWLTRTVQADWRTLETGCGHSSIVLALTGASHTIVAPFDREHERVREWCEQHGFATDNLRSVIDHSQTALPRLDLTGLDLALIDGGHAFPIPQLDWYYLAEGLRVGGYLLLDDTQLRAPRLLHDFLMLETGRWQLVEQLGKTAIFKKRDAVVIPDSDWAGQPWSTQSEDGPKPLRDALRGAATDVAASARSTVRLRTRVRKLQRARRS